MTKWQITTDKVLLNLGKIGSINTDLIDFCRIMQAQLRLVVVNYNKEFGKIGFP